MALVVLTRERGLDLIMRMEEVEEWNGCDG